MKNLNTTLAGIAVALALGASAAAFAHPGGMRSDASAGMQAGPKAGTQQHAMRDGHGPGAMRRGGQHGPQATQSLMTPDERAATKEKMRAATSPEERQQIVAATREEMQKRATERGITAPEHRGHRQGATPSAETSGHTH
jgi:hypothetical protein